MSPHSQRDSGCLRAGSWAPSRSDDRTPADRRPSLLRAAVTLVEMLVAMAITLVMMAAVVTLFANVSDSVRNRRATIELGGQLRHVRNVLQEDLANATCPGLTWRRPESNQGYIEIIEGQYRDTNPSMLTDGINSAANPELDPALSLVPRNNVVPDYNGNGKIDDEDRSEHYRHWNSLKVRQNPAGADDDATNPLVTVANGLGDYDDILMLTARNENEPFVGRVPQWDTSVTWRARSDNTGWIGQTITSPLAEVVWFAVENPMDSQGGFFGEPGMRTIYRRALLVAPWLDPYAATPLGSKPGIVRDYPDLPQDMPVAQALAELIAFQDQYDLSVRMERYPVFVGNTSRIRTRFVANTLGDLTKRENRYAHHFFNPNLAPPVPNLPSGDRQFPYAVASAGSGYEKNPGVVFVPAVYGGFSRPVNDAQATANVPGSDGGVASYTIDPANVTDANRRYQSRPLVYVAGDCTTEATARAMLNDEGQVVRVVRGMVPLWGARRGEDVMLTDVLAFDLRVYDPGAPLYGVPEDPKNGNSAVTSVLEPGDPGWNLVYPVDVSAIDDPIDGTVDSPLVGQGAYVDLGYGDGMIPSRYELSVSSLVPWFFEARALSDVYGSQLAPGYAVYDTWSFHYENDGLNEDHDSVDASGIWHPDLSGVPQIDEGTNGLDDVGSYSDTYLPSVDPPNPRLGPDDVGERETTPPYDHPLRGVQVTLRAYERDSRQIRQATVRQQFMPE